MPHIEVKIQVPIDSNARVVAAITLQEAVDRIVDQAEKSIREIASVRITSRLLARDLPPTSESDILPQYPQTAKAPPPK